MGYRSEVALVIKADFDNGSNIITKATMGDYYGSL